MANPAQPCECLPYENICCCGTFNGITVVQPLCQTLPDGSVVNNPAFVPSLNKSFWMYKFLTDCAQATRGISGFGIPICENINAANITVEEKVDGCGVYSVVPFELIATDPNFGPAPDGTVFLKVESSGRYDKGVSVIYRISITGDYPEAAEAITVKAATFIYRFGCDGCFIVPGCQLEGKLLVSKTCGIVISGNQATLQYTVNVDNVGEAALSQVFYEDTVIIPTQLTIGTVTVSPALNVDTSVKGQVTISGALGTIYAGGRVTVTYTIPITSISSPGSYSIANLAMAYATGTESSNACVSTLDVVRLSARKCCSVDGSTGTFTVVISSVGDSPDITADIFDRMKIPAGVTVMFSGFGGCEAYYAGTTTPIPLNVGLTGPLDIDIICRNVLIQAGDSIIKSISYTLVSSSVVGTTTITNTVTDVKPHSLEFIIYQGTDNLPASANIEVGLTQDCATPCV